jgi:hypothetical protein
MANHGQIVPGGDGEADSFLQPVLIQYRAHVEIVGHDQTFEIHFFAEQLRYHAMRQ